MIKKLLTRWVQKSSRFDHTWEEYVDEVGLGYKCRACGHIAVEPFKICEECFYPLPFFGRSLPKK